MIRRSFLRRMPHRRVRDQVANKRAGVQNGIVAVYPNNEGAGVTCYEIAHRPLTASRNGIFQNAPTWFDDRERGRVLKFTNTNDYVDCSNTIEFTTGSFSASCWARFDTGFQHGTLAYPGLFGRQSFVNFPGASGWALNINSTGGIEGSPYFEVGDGAGSHQVSITWNAKMSDNRWHFIVGVCDRRSQLAKISIDGQSFQTVSISTVGSVAVSSRPLKMGCRCDSGGLSGFYIGLLSECRIWGYPLELGEINYLYRAPPAGHRTPLYFSHLGAIAAAGNRQTAVSMI
jgi:hypothetical protein